MGNVFTIKGGICTADSVNWFEYDSYRAKLFGILTQSMNHTFSKLPLAKIKMAKNMIDQFMPPRKSGGEARAYEICTAILNGRGTGPAGIKAEDRKEDADFDEEEAKKQGFFTANVKTLLTTCQTEPDQYYFNGDPSCKDILNVIRGKSVPAVMYLVPMNYKNAMETLEKPENQAAYSTEFEVPGLDGVRAPLPCNGPKDEKAIYSFPYKSAIWDLRFIIGVKTLHEADKDYSYSYWFQLPYCTTTDGDKLEETKFMFDFGASVFAKMDVEIDGEKKEEAIVLNYIAAFPESSIIRSIFMKRAPGHFYKGQFNKMAYLLSIVREVLAN